MKKSTTDRHSFGDTYWEKVTGKSLDQLHNEEHGPSRRMPGGLAYLNARDREAWHLKVIADRDAHKAKVTP